MRKKIGLISFHEDPNYGTMYQAYALSRAIKSLGADAEYIKYEAIYHRSLIKRITIRVVKRLFQLLSIRREPLTEYSFLRSKDFCRLVQKYKCFHKRYIPVSKKVYFIDTIANVESEYDSFIVGSDQTWSSYCNTNPHTPNFLSFIKCVDKKNAYAPSIGSIHITREYKKRLLDELSTFNNISCREYANSKMLSEELGKKVEHVLDPTLLLTSSDWQEIESSVSMPKNYVLCYILGTKKCISDYAEKLGSTKGLPVYYMVTRPEYTDKKNVLIDIRPDQFLWLLHNASYVVTDSFHGSVFSINFNRNFYSFAKRETSESTGVDNDRIMDFLSLLGLEDRFVNDGSNIFLNDIDYETINNKLEFYRKKSLEYLKRIVTE